MRLLHLTWCIIVIACCACTPLRRGFEKNALVSPAQPPLTVQVDLPLMAAGRIAPFVYTDNSIQSPETLVGVYGTDAASPMAVTVLSEVPSRAWEWDILSYSMADGPITSTVSFGGMPFEGSLHIINGAKDAFSPLFADKGQWESLWWLAQRYACRSFFNQIKIILEYREPLPESLRGMKEVPVYNADVRAFQARAQKVFSVQPSYEGPEVSAVPFIRSLNGKALGPFLGSLSLRDPLIFDD